eukprot:GHVR01180325.1.p1 GENE.GHVR01180325.1~~GHVR01180325.1.p1  ORF type:complete len:235 (+),score=26.10 GHVR01180325.1:891-1595(+)
MAKPLTGGLTVALATSADRYANDGGPGRDDRYGLNKRRFAFICHLAVYEHLPSAMAAAGYKFKANKTASVMGSNLVGEAVTRRALVLERASIQKAQTLTTEDIAAHLSVAATVDLADVLDDDGEPLPLSDVPAATRKVLKSIEVREHYGKKGEIVGRSRRVQIGDRNAAMALLMRSRGAFAADNAQAGAGIAAGFASMFGPLPGGETIQGEYETVKDDPLPGPSDSVSDGIDRK